MLITMPAIAIILTVNPNAEYHAHYLGLLHGRNGLVGNYPFAMGCLDCRGGDFRLGHLVLRNFQPLLTVPKSRVIELALLHEVESPRGRCLPIKTSSSNTGLFFRWFRYLRSRLFRGTIAWFSLWCRESKGQFNESRVCSKLKWSRLSLCDLNKKEKPDSREMPWNSPSPKRIPRTSSCRTSLSSPRSCSAAARIIGISESSIPSDDTLGCETERDECSRMKCRSREILSYA